MQEFIPKKGLFPFDLLCKMCSTHCMLLHFNCIKPKNHFSIFYSSSEFFSPENIGIPLLYHHTIFFKLHNFHVNRVYDQDVSFSIEKP